MTSGAGVEADGFSSRRVTLEGWIRAKRPEPIHSVEDLAAPDVFPSDDEVDEFVTAVRQWRESDLA
jgi:hypothetical protein